MIHFINSIGTWLWIPWGYLYWRRGRSIKKMIAVYEGSELVGNAQVGIRLTVKKPPPGMTIDEAQAYVDKLCADVRGDDYSSNHSKEPK